MDISYPWIFQRVAGTKRSAKNAVQLFGEAHSVTLMPEETGLEMAQKKGEKG
jgi:hypothetical protein